MTRGDINTSAKERYLSEARQANAGGLPDWLVELRRKSLDEFDRMSFPNPKDEAWRNTDISPILEFPFRRADGSTCADTSVAEPYMYNAPGWRELVFVDGIFHRAVGDIEADIAAGNLLSAVNGAAGEYFGHNNRAAPPPDAFSALNGALMRDGAVIIVPDGAQARPLIHVLYITTAKEPDEACFPRSFLYAGASSRMTVVETHVALAGARPHLSDAVTDIMLAENAEVAYGKHIAQAGGYHVGAVNVRQERDSRFHSACVSSTGQILRNAINVAFAGTGAECRMDGLYLNAGNQLVDHTLSIDHSRPDCRSRIAYKGIVAEDGRAVFRGGVRVGKEAQRTDSNQVNRNLLLGDKARVDTTPQLEIYADDVKCTHGATVGSPPDDMLFYFRSRGIAEADARRILTRGFAGEIIEQIPQEPWRKTLWEYLDKNFLTSKGV